MRLATAADAENHRVMGATRQIMMSEIDFARLPNHRADLTLLMFRRYLP